MSQIVRMVKIAKVNRSHSFTFCLFSYWNMKKCLYFEMLKLIWRFSKFEKVQCRPVTEIRNNFNFNKYKFSVLSDKHITYFLFIYYFVAELLSFKNRECFRNIYWCIHRSRVSKSSYPEIVGKVVERYFVSHSILLFVK